MSNPLCNSDTYDIQHYQWGLGSQRNGLQVSITQGCYQALSQFRYVSMLCLHDDCNADLTLPQCDSYVLCLANLLTGLRTLAGRYCDRLGITICFRHNDFCAHSCQNNQGKRCTPFWNERTRGRHISRWCYPPHLSHSLVFTPLIRSYLLWVCALLCAQEMS